MVAKSDPDTILIEEAKKDPLKFDALYRKYLTQVYNYAFYHLGNRQEAEDITAKTFIQALGGLPAYTERGIPFRAWLLRIAHNLIVNTFRDASRRPAIVSWEEMSQIRDQSDSPVTLALKKAEAERLWGAVGALPEARKQVIILRFVHDMPISEIAELMDKSEGATKVLLHRAVKELAEALGKV